MRPSGGQWEVALLVISEKTGKYTWVTGRDRLQGNRGQAGPHFLHDNKNDINLTHKFHE